MLVLLHVWRRFSTQHFEGKLKNDLYTMRIAQVSLNIFFFFLNLKTVLLFIRIYIGFLLLNYVYKRVRIEVTRYFMKIQ